MKANRQRVMHCPCGNAKVLALGLCATCCTLKRQDEEYFGGLRETVLERDGYRCRVCDACGRDKRSIIVHHRRPGKSAFKLMLALCPGCHAKVLRTRAALSAMPPLLLELWRERHPYGHEQVQLDFQVEEACRQARSSVSRRKGIQLVGSAAGIVEKVSADATAAAVLHEGCEGLSLTNRLVARLKSLHDIGPGVPVLFGDLERLLHLAT